MLLLLQIMTVIVELMSNDIGAKKPQQLGQESLEALSAVYDQLDRACLSASGSAKGASRGGRQRPARVRVVDGGGAR